MAWKRTASYEWLAGEPRELGASELLSIVRNLKDRAVRVTVEEEVSECCEKWRGGVTFRLYCGRRWKMTYAEWMERPEGERNAEALRLLEGR